jgi:hypothetical protein
MYGRQRGDPLDADNGNGMSWLKLALESLIQLSYPSLGNVSFFVGISSICECTAGKEVTHFMLIMAMVASRHG